MAAPLHRHACAGVCAFVAVSVACTKQVSWALVHVQVCSLHRCSWHQFRGLQTHPLQCVCMCAHVCTIGSMALRDKRGKVKLVYARHLLLACFARIFSIFWRSGGGCACGCKYVYTYTPKHTARGVLRCEHRGQDETLGGPEECRWTKSRHICIRICVQSTHVYIYARRRDEILNQILFFFSIFFFPKRTAKDVNATQRTWIHMNLSWMKIAFMIAHIFYDCSQRNNIVVLFGTLKVQSIILTEESDWSYIDPQSRLLKYCWD